MAVAAFFVVTVIGSGGRPWRAIAWGGVAAALFVVGVLGPPPIAPIAYAVGAGVVFAGVLLPSFRSWWFGQILD